MPKETKLFVKGMVCDRCISIIQSEFLSMGIETMTIDLGQVIIHSEKEKPDLDKIESKLNKLGFDLLEDKKAKLVRQVKELVETVYSGDYDFPLGFRFSDQVTRQIHHDYDQVSYVFRMLEQKTIERYIIDYRIEKVKELLVYTSLTLESISFKLNFSSVAHLSNQFRQNTGLNPSHFRQVQKQKGIMQYSTH